ncbi:HET-domain-containing protein, partial [Rhizodiscina lignyota]
MRLLHTETLKFKEFPSVLPPYAILSHTWQTDEVLYEDILSNNAAKKPGGFLKVQKCCAVAASEGFRYIWIDTCCIDKNSSQELSEAINSMWKWYQQSTVCYAYLSDVSAKGDPTRRLWIYPPVPRKHPGAPSRWFSRGWTLQELIAPPRVIFYAENWKLIGDRMSLKEEIVEITNIEPEILEGNMMYLSSLSVAERMSWASKREVTREEDIAYCLLGLFDVNMPLLYGEGGVKAFIRLQEMIIENSRDLSVLAWTPDLYVGLNESLGILAHHPRDF